MEFTRVDTKPAFAKPIIDENYATDLQMYLDPPTDIIDIEEFQLLAVERVKLLRILETVTVRNNKESSFKDQVIDEMNKQGIKYFMPIVKGYADEGTRKRDYLSHFILRLSYCRSEDYRRWFLARELEFFRLKFYNMDRKEDIILFMKKSNLNYCPISDDEKNSLATDLLSSTAKNVILDTCSFYKVPFTQVLDLVKNRKIFLKAGNAYVPHLDLISILSSIFRTKLSQALSICSANLVSLESDERLARILKGLHTSYTGNDYSVKKDKNNVPYAAIDGLSKKSFPPCMRSMYEIFKKSHHLRYQARQQFGLFLKGIGVSLEDSLRFWKEGFTKKAEIDGEKFEKQYSYNIRHNYGVEGKRANYTPHSCMKIITSNVGAGENHGCPFRHCDVPSLRQRLQSFGLSIKDVGDVADLAARAHYQLACTRYFEITHGVQNASGINHPNQYFEESQAAILGKDNPRKEESKYRRDIKGRRKTSSEWGDDSLNLDLTAIIAEAENNATSEPMVVD